MNPKNIVFDAGGLVDVVSDVGYFTQGIITEILSNEIPYNLIGTLFADERDQPPTISHDHLHFVALSDKREHANGLFKNIDKSIRVDSIDLVVYFSGTAVPQIKKAARRALIVHDISPKDRPDLSPTADHGKFDKELAKSIKECDVVIATSDFTAGRLRKLYGTARPVEVATPAVDPSIFNQDKLESDAYLRVKHQLPQNFILYYGEISRRTNVGAIVEAYLKLPPSFQEVFGMVVAGGAIDKRTVDILKSRLPSLVIIESTEADMVAPLMRLATVFVDLSHYEGFAINALQAMACGTPVVVSSAEGIKEVVDGAGMITSNNTPDQAVRALQGLLSDIDLRGEYAARGLDRAMYFSWQNSADTILSIIGRPK
jgi:glycosyltransferase involved in cell wall biosynthesis